ncbi:hypothetical protein [Methylobacterium oxalidis]|uniref:hypothetical protein n=1 Tax=Methylobacterium oxalidis TaxID=944322 RepID=UPI00331540EE
MSKVRLLGSIDDETREALRKLLAEAGCELVDEEACGVDPDGEVDDPDGVEDPEAPEDDEPGPADGDVAVEEAEPQGDEEVGVIVLSPACLADEGLERAMQGAAARGCRVIGIWPPGTRDETLPRAFEDYGGDTVTWDAGRLRGALSSADTAPGWLKPDAQPRAERQTKRNKC